MPVNEASLEETPYGRYVTSDGWFVLNLPMRSRCATRRRAARRIHSRRGSTRSATSAYESASSRPAIRMRSTTRKACRKGSSCSRASAR